jgi:hypothetical protein
MEECRRLCVEGGVVVDTTAPRIRSDSFSFPVSTLYSMFVRIRALFMVSVATLPWLGVDQEGCLHKYYLLTGLLVYPKKNQKLDSQLAYL